jgi:hypothetical protein
LSDDLPGTPRRVEVLRGKPDGPLTLFLSWRAPVKTVGSPIVGYRVIVWQAKRDGQSARYATRLVASAKRHVRLVLPPGRYRFAVAAENIYGAGPRSDRTRWARPR